MVRAYLMFQLQIIILFYYHSFFVGNYGTLLHLNASSYFFMSNYLFMLLFPVFLRTK